MGLCQNIDLGCFLATPLLSICLNMPALRDIVKSVKIISDPLWFPFPTIPFHMRHVKKVNKVLHEEQNYELEHEMLIIKFKGNFSSLVI